MEKKERVNLKGHKKALELAMSLCFCSPAACRLLRKSGFLLPVPYTLKARFRGILLNEGICQQLVKMVRLKALTMYAKDKHIYVIYPYL